MRRIGLFLLLFGGSLAGLLLVVVWYLASYQSANASMTGMMGQMMGSQFANGLAPMPAYVWAGVAALFAVILVGIGGLAYYLAFPEIKAATTPTESSQKTWGRAGGPGENWSVLLRTSKPDERKVLEILASHGGKHLQKFLVKESGLSRLKTHRIVSRFAERGVVKVARNGNTNEVSIASWLKQDTAPAGSET